MMPRISPRILILIAALFVFKSQGIVVITRDPSNIDVCIGDTVNMPCGFTGADPRVTIPDWMRTIRNDDGTMRTIQISANELLQGSYPDHRWIPDLTSGVSNSFRSRLEIGPVDQSYNQSVYVCSFLTVNGTVYSNPGILTIIGVPAVRNAESQDGCSFVFASWNRILGPCENATYVVQLISSNMVVHYADTRDTLFNFTGSDIWSLESVGVSVNAMNGNFMGPVTTGIIPSGISQYLPRSSSLERTSLCVTQFNVTWSTNNIQCGSIDYTVSLTPPPITEKGEKSVEHTTQNVYAFSNLHNNKVYIVEVSATNRAGRGNTASTTVQTSLSLPPPPVYITPSTFVTQSSEDFAITWLEPTIDPCTTLPITGYVIKTTFNGHTITSRQISAFDQIMTISFDKIFPGNLHSNTEYNFSVTALITELDTTAVVITQDTCNNVSESSETVSEQSTNKTDERNCGTFIGLTVVFIIISVILTTITILLFWKLYNQKKNNPEDNGTPQLQKQRTVEIPLQQVDKSFIQMRTQVSMKTQINIENND